MIDCNSFILFKKLKCIVKKKSANHKCIKWTKQKSAHKKMFTFFEMFQINNFCKYVGKKRKSYQKFLSMLKLWYAYHRNFDNEF